MIFRVHETNQTKSFSGVRICISSMMFLCLKRYPFSQRVILDCTSEATMDIFEWFVEWPDSFLR